MKLRLIIFLVLFSLAPTAAEPVNLVFVGPPGAGKGTQAEMLEKQLRIPHISTGSMLRQNVKDRTELGLKAQSYMDAGELVPDEVIEGMLRNRLAREKSGFILDGYPRNLEQAQTLEKIAKEFGINLTGVVSLEVEEKELVKRLTGRGRKDDTPNVIRRRLEIYHNDTAPILNFYQKKGLLRRINGAGSFEEVNQRILHALGD